MDRPGGDEIVLPPAAPVMFPSPGGLLRPAVDFIFPPLPTGAPPCTKEDSSSGTPSGVEIVTFDIARTDSSLTDFVEEGSWHAAAA